MPHDANVILTLTGGLTAGLVFGYLTQRLRLSPIVGYLLAGIVVGPFTPGYAANGAIASELAEIGVILLMFGVGLQFRLSELLSVQRVAVPGAIVQIVAATAFGLLATHWIGWTVSAGLVFGLALSVASTVVLIRVLSDQDALHTPPGHVAVGWSVVQDLVTVLGIIFLPFFAKRSGPASASSVAVSAIWAIAKIAALIVFLLVVGRRLIPAALVRVAKTRSRELFTLTVLVIALGISVGAAKLFGASMALGAFLAGLVVGQSDFSARAGSEALPLRDAFAVLFFVSMGMLLNPVEILPNLRAVLIALAIVCVGKPLVAVGIVLLLRAPIRTALTVAVALAQIGEFSFILAALSRQLDILPETATQVLVVASIVSIALSPFLFRFVDPVSRWFERRAPSRGGARIEEESDKPRVIVIGYGPSGRALVRLLREQGMAPTVIELNHDAMPRLERDGVDAVHGDATLGEILERAGVGRATGLVFSASAGADAVIRRAREMNPKLLVMARAGYATEVPALREAGADVVVSSEVEVAFAITEQVLARFGATREQMDRARDRVREELG